jgi:tetratricopeptide (TPR) repeat protein
VAGQRLLEAAQATSAEAELALAGLDYEEAARFFEEAAELAPESALDEKGALLLRRADALQRQGDERGDNAALRKALQVYDRALTAMTRERAPLDWAMTQNNLGTALRRLGERESGAERLLEAVEAYRAAIEEWTREREGRIARLYVRDRQRAVRYDDQCLRRKRPALEYCRGRAVTTTVVRQGVTLDIAKKRRSRPTRVRVDSKDLASRCARN